MKDPITYALQRQSDTLPRDRKHIKPTHITAEIYLWDQLPKTYNNRPTRRHLKQVKLKHTQAIHTP